MRGLINPHTQASTSMPRDDVRASINTPITFQECLANCEVHTPLDHKPPQSTPIPNVRVWRLIELSCLACLHRQHGGVIITSSTRAQHREPRERAHPRQSHACRNQAGAQVNAIFGMTGFTYCDQAFTQISRGFHARVDDASSFREREKGGVRKFLTRTGGSCSRKLTSRVLSRPASARARHQPRLNPRSQAPIPAPEMITFWPLNPRQITTTQSRHEVSRPNLGARGPAVRQTLLPLNLLLATPTNTSTSGRHSPREESPPGGGLRCHGPRDSRGEGGGPKRGE